MNTIKIYQVTADYDEEYFDNGIKLIGFYMRKSKALRVKEEYEKEALLQKSIAEPEEPVGIPYDWRNPSPEWLDFMEEKDKWEDAQAFQNCYIIERELNGER